MTTDLRTEVREALASFAFTHVYIIYDADVLSDSARVIENMSPAKHVLAGWGENWRPDERPEAVAASEAFRETEDDSNYEFGYLAKESNQPRYRGVEDEEEMKCGRCGAVLVYSRDLDTWLTFEEGPDDVDTSSDTCDEAGETPHDYPGRGRHRKWVGQLTRAQWRHFASAYCIDLDDNDLPESFELTMGSITEFGHLDAISVDNREGWEDYSGTNEVISSGMYISFANAELA